MPELAPVRAVITTPLTRSGTLTHDGVVLGVNDAVLYAVPGDLNNGPFLVQTGPWTERSDFFTAYPLASWLTVLGGASAGRAGSIWYFANDAAPTRGISPLNWLQRDHGQAIRATPGAGLAMEGRNVALEVSPIVAGTYTAPTVQYDEYARPVRLDSGGVPTTSLEGLEPVYNSTTSLTVKAGSLWIPGLDRILDFPNAVTKTGLTFAVGWNNVYAYDNAGVPDIEISTVAPAEPYRGGARTKGGATPDTSRRLIHSVYAPNGTAMRRWQRMGASSGAGFMRWVANLEGVLRAGAALMAQSGAADLDVSVFAPPYASGVEVALFFINTDNISTFYVSAAGDGLMTVGGSEAAGQLWVGTTLDSPRRQTSGPIAFAGSTTLRHRQTALGTTRSGNIDVMGYYQELS